MGPPLDDDTQITRTSIGARTLLQRDRLLAGRYRILEPIGAGGMGVVYRARDERLAIDVAVKVLRQERSPDPQMLERFERELKLARAVSHPNVVRIHDIGQDGELHFITMDLVDGRSLRELIENEGAVDVDTAVGIAINIADGLKAAHRKGVVHRDLKPANILLGDDGRACILDFGVARSLHSAKMTETGLIVGSLDHLAPEQARGDEIDGRADIYALGLIMYEMLSGQLPFSGGTVEEVLAQRTVGAPKDLASTGVDLPAWLRNVVATCLANEPGDRFQSAEDLAHALRTRSGPGLRLARLMRRVRKRAGILAAAGLLLATLLAALTLRPDEPADDDSVRLAVLSLANETGSPDMEWLAAGMNDLLASQFSSSTGVELIDALRISDTLADLKLEPTSLDSRSLVRLSDLLSADVLMTGSLRPAGNDIRIDANLRRRSGGGPIRLSVASPAGAPRELVAELAQAVRDALAVPESIGADDQLSAKPQALAAYVDGRNALDRGDFGQAIPRLETATSEDPQFAVAWLQLARAYNRAGYGDRAVAAVERAMTLTADEGSRTALQTRALAAALNGDFEKSREILAALVERFPRDGASQLALAEAYGDEGRFSEAMVLLEAVVEEDPSHPIAWFLLGKYAIGSGENRRAIDEYLVRHLVVQNKLNNDGGRGDAYNAMGIAYDRIGRIEAARENYEKAAELRGRTGDRRGMATSLNNLATIERILGNFDAARARLEQARAVSMEMGDEHRVAAFINTMGSVEEEAGNYTRALAQYREALQIRERLGDRRALTESYNNVGYAYFMLGQLDNARLYWQRTLSEARELENPDAEMQALQNLGRLYTATAQWEPALKAYFDSLTISRDLHSPQGEAVSLGEMGYISALQGRYESGLAQIDSAIDILHNVQDTLGLSEFSLRRAAVLIELGMFSEAKSLLESVSTWLAQTPNLDQQAAYQRLNALLLGTDRSAEATELLAKAMDTATRSGSVTALLRARLATAERLLETGEPADALAGAQSVALESALAGFSYLELQAIFVQAKAMTSLSEAAAAVEPIERMIELLDEQSPLGLAYKMRRLAARVLASAGQAHRAAMQSQLADAGLAALELPPGASETLRAAASAANQSNLDAADEN